jgi:hypothetical protein
MTRHDAINICSIGDAHVRDLLSLFELKTNDPLFDGGFLPTTDWLVRSTRPYQGAHDPVRDQSVQSTEKVDVR